jgi:predicted PurR-regulated permease PerM
MSESPQPIAPGTREAARRAAVQAGVVLGVVLLALLLWATRQVLLLLFAAVLLGVALQALAAPLARRTRLPYPAALAVVTVALVGGLALLLTLVGPSLASQTAALSRDLPAAIERLEARLDDYRWGREAIERTQEMQRSFSRLGGQDLWARLAGVFSTVIGAAGAILVILVVGIYLAAGAPRYVDALVRVFPRYRRARMVDVVQRAVHLLRWWLLGRFLTMVFVGVVVGVGLALLGVPLALTLGVLAGLLDFVPNVGPIVAAVPALLLAVVHSPTLALWVALLYLGVQAAEGYLISPLVERRTVSLEPAAVIAAQLVAAVLFGAVGVVLASPLAAVALVCVRMLYLEDALGEKDARARTRAAEEHGPREAARRESRREPD